MDEIRKAIARLEAATLLRGQLGQIAHPLEDSCTDEELQLLLDGAADGEVTARGLADAARADLLELFERLHGDPPAVDWAPRAG